MDSYVEQKESLGESPCRLTQAEPVNSQDHQANRLPGRWTGLRARLMLFVTAVLLGPLGIIVYFAYDRYDDTKQYILNDIVNQAENLAASDYGIDPTTRQLLLSLSLNDAILGHDGERCSQIAKTLLAANARYVSIGAVGLDGMVFCLGTDILHEGQNLSDRGWFREAVTNRGFSKGHYVVGRNVKVPQLVFGYLADQKGEPKAVIFVGYDVDWLSRFIGGQVRNKYVTTYLVDKKGLVLARSDYFLETAGKRIEDRRFIDALEQGEEKPIVVKEPTGIERAYVIRPLSSVGAGSIYAAVGYDLNLPVDEGLAELYRLLVPFAVVAILTYLVAWWSIALTIMAPIQRLLASVTRFRGGDFSVQSGPDYARNEIGALGRSFDEMANAVNRHQADLKAAETTAQNHTRDINSLFQASPAAIVALDREAKVMWWNPAAERIFGYSAVEVIGRPHPVVPELETGHFRSHFERALRGELLRNIRGIRRARDGRKVEVEFSSAPLSDADGNVIGVVNVIDDVTERTQLERQFLQAQKMEAVGQLTGGIAHDFNNLLGVLIGNLDLASERLAGNPEALKLVNAALDAGLRGAELNKRLLAFARRQALSPEIVDVNAILSATTELLRRSLGERIEIHLECAADIWPVWVDPAYMESTIVNLAVNARDAMPEGGVLTLETRNVTLDADCAAALHAAATPGDYLMLAVTDTGVGMTPEIRRRVFEPFFTTKPAGKGTGLGLSMVHGFIMQSGGQVNVYSEPDKGTTVRLYLPRAASEKARREAPVAGKSVERTETELVLVVEDNPDMRRMAARQLKEAGYRVVEAENADRARAVLGEGLKPDLIFVDAIMPGSMNGVEFAEAVAGRLPGVRILLTSGFTERATVEARRREGRPLPFALLGKPYRKGELVRAIRTALDKAS